jgi:transcriptional regulator with XRE-family HTH domain
VLQPLDDSASRQHFAWRLRATRRAYGGLTGQPNLSARQFARILGIFPERYRRYERGELEPPLSVLTSLRRVTGVSLDRLVSGDINGDDNMIPMHGMRSNEEMILADRLRCVRELGEPDVASAAQIMNVPLEDWKRWEAGATRPSLDKLVEFSIRFQVSLDFLLTGSLDSLRPYMRNLLLSKFPALDPSKHPRSNEDDHSRHRAQADICR